ncbi:hypothetical protein CF70_012990 [Cupriavidus sp. SK-3]|uniref:hypothetical protein n=1 Tax=Cupriavidus sp. SK-3 TaxID=1470558 RepID=UPI00044646B7|nr:hypothetical protein [Cupriavidus sp. SK-3]KDP85608.1 hypothetical protein CF70_012990 [Cupriavidus sp. SK-3]
MAKASQGGGGGPDILLIAAVGAMAFLALRSRTAGATGVPMTTASQLRPDYTAQRNIAYTQAGVGLLASLRGLGGGSGSSGSGGGWSLGNLFGTGSPDALFSGGGTATVGGIFGGRGYDVANFNNGYGNFEESMSGLTDKEIGNLNGAYGFGSLVQYPGFGG